MVRTFIREKKIFCGDHYREVDIFGYTTAQKNAAALVGLDVQDVTDNDGNYIGFVKKYKMADKIRALELLGKHLGAWEPRDKQQTAVEDLTALAEKLRAREDG